MALGCIYKRTAIVSPLKFRQPNGAPFFKVVGCFLSHCTKCLLFILSDKQESCSKFKMEKKKPSSRGVRAEPFD